VTTASHYQPCTSRSARLGGPQRSMAVTVPKSWHDLHQTQTRAASLPADGKLEVCCEQGRSFLGRIPESPWSARLGLTGDLDPKNCGHLGLGWGLALDGSSLGPSLSFQLTQPPFPTSICKSHKPVPPAVPDPCNRAEEVGALATRAAHPGFIGQVLRGQLSPQGWVMDTCHFPMDCVTGRP
jgi:hypothetical protein